MSSPLGGVNTGQLRRLPRTWLLQNCTGADYAGKIVSTKRIINIFTRKSMEKGWGRRINTLLDISVSQDDELPAYICNKCIARIVTLEKAFIDRCDFKKSARACMEQGHHSLKRTKATTGEVGVSPNTFRERPRSKVARRLRFTSK